jgi:Acetyltransferases, including N-acetylases of ribosomal proteins
MYIKQDNLLIRDAESRDADLLCGWWNDGAVMAHAGFPNGLGTTPEAIRTQLVGDDDTHRRCIIELNGEPIGEMNYRTKSDVTINERAAEIGIKICDAAQREHGYGTKLLTMFIDELFGRYGFDVILLDTNLKNTRAQHVYEKLGFIKIRTEYGSWQNQVGEAQSQIYYKLDKSDWHNKIN